MRFLKFFLWLILGCAGAATLAVTGTFLYLSPNLPSVETLRSIQLQIPLRIYTQDEKLIAEFGEMRRTPIKYDEIPQDFINALLAAEDDNFTNHRGVEITSLARAATQLAKTGHIQSGGSTITMQVAKNFFLSSDRVFSRKLNEILLALQIERELTKPEIFELYVNKIYLGHRAYGIESAAQVYYGKSIQELDLAQLAMIAGLPKAPSAFNPIVNPERSKERRDWILGRMLRLGMIDQNRYETAVAQAETAKYHFTEPEVYAPYIAEMARAEMVGRYGSEAYTEGFRVYVTANSDRQTQANEAVRQGLFEYDQRHGYRGPELKLADQSRQQWLTALQARPSQNGLQAAVVSSIGTDHIKVLLRDGNETTVDWSSMKWARPYINANSQGRTPSKPADVVQVGDVIRIRWEGDKALFTQIPSAQSALIALNPQNGAIEALVGGFSFEQSHYNRATQAKRQPGSSFKPFIYSAALDKGYTPATLVNDSPLVYYEQGMNKAWRPKNDNNTFLGPIPVREALYKSRNLVSIRLLQAIGLNSTVDYLGRFGFTPESLPKNLSLALGTADLTPMEVATGWTVFANGGHKIEPYIIESIVSRDGDTLYSATPATVGSEENPAEAVINEGTAFLVTNMLKDVIVRGTGRRALALGRKDLAGKTGTTNNSFDSWFSGYNADLVTTVWAGFDQPQTLGRREYGGTVALPIWIKFMGQALKNLPEHNIAQPSNVVSLRVDRETGRLANNYSLDTYSEFFRSDSSQPEAQTTEGFDNGSGIPHYPTDNSPAPPIDLF